MQARIGEISRTRNVVFKGFKVSVMRAVMVFLLMARAQVQFISLHLQQQVDEPDKTNVHSTSPVDSKYLTPSSTDRLTPIALYVIWHGLVDSIYNHCSWRQIEIHASSE